MTDPKPTPEMREKGFDFAAKWCNPEYFCEGEAQDMADEFAYALAVAAHKAALEADARVAAMREAILAVLNDRILGDKSLSRRIATIARIRALSLPTGDRFMQLLEAAQKLKFGPYPAHGSGFVVILSDGDLGKFKEALSAFPQPEKQP